MNIRALFAEHCHLIEQFFSNSNKAVIILLDENLTITDCSPGFKSLLKNEKACGLNIRSLLLAESHSLLPFSKLEKSRNIRLSFRLKDSTVFTLDCQIFKTADAGWLIMGEYILFTNDQVLEEIAALTNEMVGITKDLNRKNRELEQARTEIKTLSGIIPICAYCKKIRNDKGYWDRLETFISQHSEAELSHSICDKCLEERYPEEEIKSPI